MEENKGTWRVIKGVVVLICCVLPCKSPFALASLMETLVKSREKLFKILFLLTG